MTKYLAAPLALVLWASPAFANHHEEADCSKLEGEEKEQCEKAAAAAAEAMAETKKALEALGDCSDKEGEEKETCETEKAELEAKLAPPAEEEAAEEEGKGGKAKRSNTNRMEAELEDE